MRALRRGARPQRPPEVRVCSNIIITHIMIVIIIIIITNINIIIIIELLPGPCPLSLSLLKRRLLK